MTTPPNGRYWLEKLRADGWMVAVHNDYRLNGEFFTFWLLTKNGRYMKGEGRSDEEALRAALAASLPEEIDAAPEAPTMAEIEELRREHYIPDDGKLEPWAVKENAVLTYLCYRAAAPLPSQVPVPARIGTDAEADSPVSKGLESTTSAAANPDSLSEQPPARAIPASEATYKLARGWYPYNKDMCLVVSAGLDRLEMALDTALRQLAELRSQPPASAGAKVWIPASAQKPPHGEDVLFITDTGLWLGWRRQEDGDWLDHFDDGKICTDVAVLFWMLPPSPPSAAKPAPAAPAESATPRTDQATYLIPEYDDLRVVEGLTEVVSVDTAKKLERDLAKAEMQNFDHALAIAKLERELAKAVERERLANMRADDAEEARDA